MEKKKIVYALAVGNGYYLQTYSQGGAYCYAPLKPALPITWEQFLKEQDDLNEEWKRKSEEAGPLFFDKKENIKKYIEKCGTWKDFIDGTRECVGKIDGYPKIVKIELCCYNKVFENEI